MSNPTTLVESFASELGAFSGSGAIRFASGLWLEQGTTNLLANPIFFDDTSGWGFGGANRSVTWTDSLPYPLPDELADSCTTGVYALATGQMTGTFPGIGSLSSDLTLAASAHMCSVYLYIPSGWSGGTPRLYIGNLSGASGEVLQLANMSIRDDWQRVECGPFTPGVDVTGRPAMNIEGTGSWNNGEYLWIAGFQFEQQSIATSLAEASFGTGYSASPAPHSRAASSAAISPTGILAPGSGALAFRFRRLIDTGGTETILICGTAGSGTDYLSISVNSSDKLVVSWNSDNAGAQTVTSTDSIAVDTEYFVYTDWNSTDINLRVDTTTDTDTRDAVQDDFGAGDLTLEASAGGAIFNGFAAYDRPLTDYEQSRLYAQPVWGLQTLKRSNKFNTFQLRPIGA